MIGTAADQIDLHYSLKKAAQQTESPNQNEEEKQEKLLSIQDDVEYLAVRSNTTSAELLESNKLSLDDPNGPDMSLNDLSDKNVQKLCKLSSQHI